MPSSPGAPSTACSRSKPTSSGCPKSKVIDGRATRYGRLGLFITSAEAQPTYPSPGLSFTAAPAANRGVSYRTKTPAAGPRARRTMFQDRSYWAPDHFVPVAEGSHGVRRAFLRVFSKPTCVHTNRERYSASLRAFIWRFRPASPPDGTQTCVSERIERQKLLRSPLCAGLRRCRLRPDAEYSVFCTVRTGVGSDNTQLNRIFMQYSDHSMQIKN